jgi:carboxyl-terminal processing protease
MPMEQQPRLPLWFLIANWALICAAFVVGVTLGGAHKPEFPMPQGRALELVYDEIMRNHVEQQDGHELLDRAITAMAGKLDEYSQYIPPSRVAQYEEMSTGRYEGVGLLQVMYGEDIVVHFPFDGGPADRAGVLPGDRIVAVNGTLVASLPLATRSEQVRNLVRGPADSDVTLKLGRGDKELELTVHRGDVQRSSVKWAHLADPAQGLGYIYVADFHHGVAEELLTAIARLQSQSLQSQLLQTQSPLRGLILDLRFNPGGNLDDCVRIARTFQPTGTIVSTRRRNEVLESHEARRELCKYPDLPLVVLVNENSASASEVLAGCLQDHGRAALVGTRTYGKGVVNTVYTWKDLPFRLKLTTAHYFTPNGRNIEGHSLARSKNAVENGSDTPDPAKLGGILPDEVVPSTKEQQQALLNILDGFELPSKHVARFQAVVDKYKAVVPAPPQPDTDPQLQKALEVLRKRVDAPPAKPADPAKDK